MNAAYTLTRPEPTTETDRIASRAREDLALLADLYRRVPGLDATWTPYSRLARRRRRCPSLWAHLKTWAMSHVAEREIS